MGTAWVLLGCCLSVVRMQPTQCMQSMQPMQIHATNAINAISAIRARCACLESATNASGG
eukprot:6083368-Lingulodinium_polyedra.AAC.1